MNVTLKLHPAIRGGELIIRFGINDHIFQGNHLISLYDYPLNRESAVKRYITNLETDTSRCLGAVAHISLHHIKPHNLTPDNPTITKEVPETISYNKLSSYMLQMIEQFKEEFPEYFI